MNFIHPQVGEIQKSYTDLLLIRPAHSNQNQAACKRLQTKRVCQGGPEPMAILHLFSGGGGGLSRPGDCGRGLGLWRLVCRPQIFHQTLVCRSQEGRGLPTPLFPGCCLRQGGQRQELVFCAGSITGAVLANMYTT